PGGEKLGHAARQCQWHDAGRAVEARRLARQAVIRINDMKTIDDVNAMSEGEFIAAFGDVAELSPWVAQAAATRRPFHDRADMIDAFAAALKRASEPIQLDLIRAHPDLATK